jgi:ABC-type amino acid transport substrate-binding protein
MSEAKRRRVVGVLGALLASSLPLWRPRMVRAAVPRAPLRLTVVNLMPWAGYTQQGRPTGALIELTAQLSKLSGVALDILLVPYGRAPHMLTNGGTDLMLSIDVNTPGTPIESVGMVEIMMVGRNGFRFQQLEDLHGKTVSYLRGARYADLEADQRILKHAVDSYEQALRMLLAGRIDVLVGVGDSIEYALRKLETPMALVSPRYRLSRGNLALYSVPAIDQQISLALQSACRQLRQKRLLDELLNRGKVL